MALIFASRQRLSAEIVTFNSSGTTGLRRNTASTPSIAARSASTSSSSPLNGVTPGANVAFSGERVNARTSSPAATSCSTTTEPTLPVAPVTRTLMFFSYTVKNWMAVRLVACFDDELSQYGTDLAGRVLLQEVPASHDDL